MNRPTALIVVAWLWIIIAIFYTAYGVGISFKTMTVFNQLETELGLNDPSIEKINALEPIAAIKWMLYSACAVVILVGIFIVVAGFYLLQLRNWARLSLEICSWFGLIWYILNLILVIKDFPVFKTSLLEMQKSAPSYWLALMGQLIGLIGLVLCIVSIIILRRKSVRDAIKAGHP